MTVNELIVVKEGDQLFSLKTKDRSKCHFVIYYFNKMLKKALPIQLMANLEGRMIEVISFIKIKYLTTTI